MAIKRGLKVDKAFSAASMTDLMFLLLMFMLISSTLINSNALNLLLPKSTNQVTAKPYTTISVSADMQYYIDRQPVAFDALEGALRAKLAGEEDPVVSLNCEKSVPIDEVVKVMNIAKNNGYKLILATQPEQ